MARGEGEVEIATVLRRVAELHSALSNAIERCLRSSLPSPEVSAARGERSASAVQAEMRVLLDCRDALEDMESQLENVHVCPASQRDAALRVLEERRQKLAACLHRHDGAAEAHGCRPRESEVVSDLLSFIGEAPARRCVSEPPAHYSERMSSRDQASVAHGTSPERLPAVPSSVPYSQGSLTQSHSPVAQLHAQSLPLALSEQQGPHQGKDAIRQQQVPIESTVIDANAHAAGQEQCALLGAKDDVQQQQEDLAEATACNFGSQSSSQGTASLRFENASSSSSVAQVLPVEREGELANGDGLYWEEHGESDTAWEARYAAAGKDGGCRTGAVRLRGGVLRVSRSGRGVGSSSAREVLSEGSSWEQNTLVAPDPALSTNSSPLVVGIGAAPHQLMLPGQSGVTCSDSAVSSGMLRSRKREANGARKSWTSERGSLPQQWQQHEGRECDLRADEGRHSAQVDGEQQNKVNVEGAQDLGAADSTLGKGGQGSTGHLVSYPASPSPLALCTPQTPLTPVTAVPLRRELSFPAASPKAGEIRQQQLVPSGRDQCLCQMHGGRVADRSEVVEGAVGPLTVARGLGGLLSGVKSALWGTVLSAGSQALLLMKPGAIVGATMLLGAAALAAGGGPVYGLLGGGRPRNGRVKVPLAKPQGAAPSGLDNGPIFKVLNNRSGPRQVGPQTPRSVAAFAAHSAAQGTGSWETEAPETAACGLKHGAAACEFPHHRVAQNLQPRVDILVAPKLSKKGNSGSPISKVTAEFPAVYEPVCLPTPQKQATSSGAAAS